MLGINDAQKDRPMSLTLLSVNKNDNVSFGRTISLLLEFTCIRYLGENFCQDISLMLNLVVSF